MKLIEAAGSAKEAWHLSKKVLKEIRGLKLLKTSATMIFKIRRRNDFLRKII
jgi:hypothetical protein